MAFPIRHVVDVKMAKRLLRVENCISGLRNLSTTSVNNGKRNFRQLQLYNFRGSRHFKKQQEENPDPEIPIHTYGVREPGYKKDNKFHFVPEMVPELIVPDLTGFTLKPYVSYQTSDVNQSEFTAQDLFMAIYGEKIEKDLKKGKLDKDGNPMEPNEYEKLTPEKAELQARQTGSDLFG